MSSSVKKAVTVLHLLGNAGEGMNLTTISKELNMDKTTTFRYLETLVEVGLVEKKDNNTYCLGMVLFELGSKVPVKQLFITKIDPFMKRLCEDVNETVNLAQLYQGRLLYLHKIESKRSLQMRATLGNQLPLNCTAIGKSILSILPADETRKIIDNIKFQSFTPSTITNKTKFKEEITRVKTNGYSTDLEEFEIGLTCIAVPLNIMSHDFYGALSISAPTMRVNASVMDQFIQKLKATRDEILNSFS